MMEIEKSHFEVMEELGQLTIFDLPAHEAESKENQLNIGDKVRCHVSEGESEAYYYLKYYYPNALTSVGEIVDIEGNTVYTRFKGDIIPLERHQVSL